VDEEGSKSGRLEPEELLPPSTEISCIISDISCKILCSSGHLFEEVKKKVEWTGS
jgi:hypothetical protein